MPKRKENGSGGQMYYILLMWISQFIIAMYIIFRLVVHILYYYQLMLSFLSFTRIIIYSTYFAFILLSNHKVMVPTILMHIF